MFEFRRYAVIVTLAFLACTKPPGSGSGGGNAGIGGGSAMGGGDGTGAGGSVTAATSTLTVDRSTGVLADGLDTATLTITLRAADGTPATGVSVTLTVTGTQNTLTAPGLTDSNGVAQARLSSTRAETKIASATLAGAQGNVVSLTQHPTIRFVSGTGTLLEFQQSPGSSVAGALTPAPVLKVSDTNGNPVPDATIVTLGLTGGTAGAQLLGTTTASTVGGRATFALDLDVVGTAYRLVASSAGATSVSSAPFDIRPAAAHMLAFQAQPTAGLAGVPLAPAFEVVVRDRFGNLTLMPPTSITLAVSGTPVLGTDVATSDGGVALFADIALGPVGTHVFTATAPALLQATSGPVLIRSGAPSAMFSTLQATPAQLLADGVTNTTLTVTLRDAFQNVVEGEQIFLSGVALDGGLTVVQPATATDNAGLASGLARCSAPQIVSFTGVLNGSTVTPAADVNFTVCVPGATATCYSGASGTLGVGPCTSGTSTCTGVGAWGPCVGEVSPRAEVCANGVDENCNGTPDDDPDIDGDGWSRCTGDCCESLTGCSVPTAVNPGAFEAVGNGVDDDCDPTTSDLIAAPPCSTAQKFSAVTAADFHQAMDLCQTTLANPPANQRKWGVITASHRLADGTSPAAVSAAMSDMQNFQTAVMTTFGTNSSNNPRRNITMGSLSTGRARDSNDTGFVSPVSGSNFGRTLPFPGAGSLATYLAAHGGALDPGNCGSMTCPTGTGAYDSVNVRLTIRVPTNALGLSYDFKFFSGEYQTYQCTTFNDYYLAMLTSLATGTPADRQISYDALNNPISVNNGFFEACGGNGRNCAPCPDGVAPLAGTGFDSVSGGATAWLTTDAPVVPGEVITLEFILFDVNDSNYDSTMLFDNFRWSLTPVTPGTHK